MRVRTCLAIDDTRRALPSRVSHPGSLIGIEDAIDAAGAAGFRCLDLHVSALEAYLADYPTAVLGALLAESGVHVGVVSGLSLPPLARVESRILAEAQILELCTHLDALGGGVIALCPLPTYDALPGPSDTEAVRVLRALADLVAPFDVRLALEIRMDKNAQGIAAVLEWAGEIVTRVRRAGVGLALDLRGELAPHPPDVVFPEQNVATLHLVRLGMLETGTDPRLEALRALCAGLAHAGFHGPYSVDPLPAAPTLVEGARAAFERAEALFASPAIKER